MIENDLYDPHLCRCGHNFPTAECPYRHCAPKALLAACKLDDICERHRFGETESPNALREACAAAGHKPPELIGDFVRRFRREALKLAEQPTEGDHGPSLPAEEDKP